MLSPQVFSYFVLFLCFKNLTLPDPQSPGITHMSLKIAITLGFAVLVTPAKYLLVELDDELEQVPNARNAMTGMAVVILIQICAGDYTKIDLHIHW